MKINLKVKNSFEFFQQMATQLTPVIAAPAVVNAVTVVAGVLGVQYGRNLIANNNRGHWHDTNTILPTDLNLSEKSIQYLKNTHIESVKV